MVHNALIIVLTHFVVQNVLSQTEVHGSLTQSVVHNALIIVLTYFVAQNILSKAEVYGARTQVVV